MSPPINLDGDTVDAITMDGDSVGEVTVDGSTVFNDSLVPDAADLHSNHDVNALSASDGDSITTLPDQTGNGFDLSAESTNSSTYDADLINGNPGLDMPSGSQLYETATDLAQPVTIFFVGAVNSTGGSRDQVIAGGAGDALGTGQLTEKVGDFKLLAGNFPSATTSDTNLHIFSMLFNGSNSVLRIDGTEFSPLDAGTNNIFQLGLNGEASESRSPGIKAGQMLTYPQDKSGIFGTVESYLSDKWAISV